MRMTKNKPGKFLRYLIKVAGDDGGMAAAEAALILPLLMIFLVGVFEIGMGISSNQKTIRASQIVADLLSRERVVNGGDIAEAFEAARQAILPLDDSNLGIDVVSVEFEEDSSGNEQINTLWRETQNMNADAFVVNDMSGLGGPGEGALGVVVTYEYRPLFSSFMVGRIDMREVSFVRSRKSSVIIRQN